MTAKTTDNENKQQTDTGAGKGKGKFDFVLAEDHATELLPALDAKQVKCNYNCDTCSRTLCTEGNPTLEPTAEELQQSLDDAEQKLAEYNRVFESSGKLPEE